MWQNHNDVVQWKVLPFYSISSYAAAASEAALVAFAAAAASSARAAVATSVLRAFCLGPTVVLFSIS